jgi:hypothetical protein
MMMDTLERGGTAWRKNGKKVYYSVIAAGKPLFVEVSLKMN